MPNRKTFFAANFCPGPSIFGIEIIFPISTPNVSDATSGEIVSNFQ
jgi:hypothetical protein